MSARDKLRELVRVLHELALVSHSNAANYEFAPSAVGRGERWRTRDKPPVPHLGPRRNPGAYDSKKPQGATDWVGDHAPEYRQKSAQYFINQLYRDVRSEADLDALLEAARAALTDWRKTPLPAGQEPPRVDPQWKRWVAESDERAEDIARRHGVSARYIRKVRASYGNK